MISPKVNYIPVIANSQVFVPDLFLEHAIPRWKKHNPQSKAICICLHGFTATPFEVTPVADAIFDTGLDTATVLFPAHGIKDEIHAKKATNHITYQDLLNAARNEIGEARKRYDHVYIYGQSMGGLVAIAMAVEDLVDGLAATAPALIIPIKERLLVRMFAWTKLILNKKERIDFFNESYPFTNVHLVQELIKLGKNVRKHLYQIKCPIFECHSTEDVMVPIEVPKLLEQTLPNLVKIQWFNMSGHTMPLDVQGKEVCAAISKFFNSLEN